MTPWEGGTKVGAFLPSADEDRIPRARRGTTGITLGHVTDLFPTLLGLAGGDASPTPTGKLSSYDMWDA